MPPSFLSVLLPDPARQVFFFSLWTRPKGIFFVASNDGFASRESERPPPGAAAEPTPFFFGKSVEPVYKDFHFDHLLVRDRRGLSVFDRYRSTLFPRCVNEDLIDLPPELDEKEGDILPFSIVREVGPSPRSHFPGIGRGVLMCVEIWRASFPESSMKDRQPASLSSWTPIEQKGGRRCPWRSLSPHCEGPFLLPPPIPRRPAPGCGPSLFWRWKKEQRFSLPD